MDQVTVMIRYRVDGTTKDMTLRGAKFSIQMRKRCTIVDMDNETHLFRRADHVHVIRATPTRTDT